MHNLGSAVASYIVFKPSCDGVTDTTADTRHIVCSDARRYGIRKFGQNDVNIDTSGTPSPAPVPVRSSNSNTTLTVVVIVIALIAAVLAFFVARRYFCTSPSHSSSPRMNERTVGLISKDDSHSGTSGAANPNKLSFISSDEALRQIRLEQQDVSVTKSVGTGRLWIGDYSGRKVMIKRIEAESSDSYATKALITQARSLAPLSHPNIVSLVGVTWVQGTDFGVVGEFMEKGTLRSVLMDLDSELDLQTKLHMCLDVALALKHLHTTDMYMRRLTSRKVLVNSAMDCKLNLFECHPATNKIEYPEVFGAGEMAWEAPELITRTGILDPRKINIFSLGVLIGEIMTRVSPYQSAVDAVGNTLADLELVKRIRRQERLMPHENRREFTELPAALRDMVERCLSYQPLTRPSAEEVIVCLESVKEYSERFGSTTSL
jgi:serine/threonine protein kinase